VTPYLTFGSSVQDVVIEDLTGDGIEEIAIADRTSIRIREGLGGGTFGPVVTLPSNVDNVGLAAADVDGDGLPELVAASGNTSDLTVFCNASVGSLRLRVGYPFTRDTVHWSDQGPGATFSLASGSLNDLLLQRTFAGATCLTTTATTSYVDARPLPAPAPPTDRSAFYYLVRCSGPECSELDFGTLSDGRPRFGPASPGAVPDPCP
jgi:hypothetical protein